MTGQIARRVLWALVIALVAVGIVASAFPYVASTRIVRDRIAIELGRWSGYRVEIGATPRLQVWPRLSAELENVTFSEWSSDPRVMATADRIEVDLSAMAALAGNAVFTAARVIRPKIVIEPDTEALDLLAGHGRLRNAVDRARAAMASESESETTLDDAFGTVAIVDGRIVSRADIDKAVVDDLEVQIDLPRLGGGGSLVASGKWNGKEVKAEVRSDGPVRLLAGGESALDVSLESDPAKGSFEGKMRLGDTPSIDGMLSLEAGKVGSFLSWMGIRWSGMEALPPLAFSATAVGDRNRVKFDGASLVIDGETGAGGLEAALSDHVVTLTGSLDFATLPLGVLPSFLRTMTSSMRDAERPDAPRLPAVRTDLRISASEAVTPGYTLNQVAATMRVRDGTAAFQLLDAAGFGGRVDASLQLAQPDKDLTAKLHIEGRNVDGAPMAAAAGIPGLLPDAKGHVLVDMEGQGNDLSGALLNARGSASAVLGAGSLADIDLGVFLEKSATGEFFALAETRGSSMALDSLDVETTITAGIVRIRKAEAVAGGRRIWLDGLASYRDRGLALSGGIGPVGSGTAAAKDAIPDEARFFVGGSWGAPFVSPIRSQPPAQ
jgi:AsmA protein